tara:strand:+ start:467 stop:1036 length:570 start_codon:yes stop_codon:yes gene_type:complete
LPFATVVLPARIAKAFSSDARVSVLNVQSVPDLDEARVLLELQRCSRPPCAVSADRLATQLQLRTDQLDTEMLHVKWTELASGAQGSDPTQGADPTPTTAFWLLLAFASAGTTLLVVRRSVSRTDPSRGYSHGRRRRDFPDDEDETMSLAPSFVLRDLAARADSDTEEPPLSSLSLRDLAGRAHRDGSR